MKFYLCLICCLFHLVLSAVVTEFEKKQFFLHKEVCMDETKINDSVLIESILKDDYSNIHCLIKCVYVRSGILNENGTINMNIMENAISDIWKPTDMHNVQVYCGNLFSSDSCEFAFLIHGCYFGDDGESVETNISTEENDPSTN